MPRPESTRKAAPIDNKKFADRPGLEYPPTMWKLVPVKNKFPAPNNNFPHIVPKRC